MILIQPQQVELDGKTYIISKIPATDAREIITQYLPSAMPKLGEYKRNEELMYKLMAFVAVITDSGAELILNSKTLINNHVESWETLLRLEAKMMEYNCSFFRDGRISGILTELRQTLPAWISKILMDSLERLSQAEKQRSTNSEQSTV